MRFSLATVISLVFSLLSVQAAVIDQTGPGHCPPILIGYVRAMITGTYTFMWNFGDADHDGRNDSNQVFDAVDRLIEKCAPEKVPQYRAAVEKIKEKNLEDNMRFTEEDMLSALDHYYDSHIRRPWPRDRDTYL